MWYITFVLYAFNGNVSQNLWKIFGYCKFALFLFMFFGFWSYFLQYYNDFLILSLLFPAVYHFSTPHSSASIFFGNYNLKYKGDFVTVVAFLKLKVHKTAQMWRFVLWSPQLEPKNGHFLLNHDINALYAVWVYIYMLSFSMFERFFDSSHQCRINSEVKLRCNYVRAGLTDL